MGIRVGLNSVVVGWVFATMLAVSAGVDASRTAVVLEIANPVRDTNNKSDMVGRDVGFIFAQSIIPLGINSNCDMFVGQGPNNAIFCRVDLRVFFFCLLDGNSICVRIV